jgi:hypothetical protein
MRPAGVTAELRQRASQPFLDDLFREQFLILPEHFRALQREEELLWAKVRRDEVPELGHIRQHESTGANAIGWFI